MHFIILYDIYSHAQFDGFLLCLRTNDITHNTLNCVEFRLINAHIQYALPIAMQNKNCVYTYYVVHGIQFTCFQQHVNCEVNCELYKMNNNIKGKIHYIRLNVNNVLNACAEYTNNMQANRLIRCDIHFFKSESKRNEMLSKFQQQ